MEEQIQNLSNSQIRFIVRHLVAQSKPEELNLKEIPELMVERDQINYPALQSLLTTLANHVPGYDKIIADLIEASIKDRDNSQVIAMDPVTGMVTVSISFMFLLYKLTKPIVDFHYPQNNIQREGPVFDQLIRFPEDSDQISYNEYLDQKIQILAAHYQQKIKESPKADILILTVMPVEYEAIKARVEHWDSIDSPIGSKYEVAHYRNLKIAHRQTIDQGNPNMAAEVERAIHFINPKVIFLTGIAGGLKKVDIGDVVVGNRVYSYDSGKQEDDGLKYRDKGGRFNLELTEKGAFLIKNKGLHYFESNHKAILGPTVSGEKVITSDQTKEFQSIRERFEDALAVEMESLGLSIVLHTRPDIQGINIRGISDLPSNQNKDKTYYDGGRELAAQNASIFTFDLIDSLNL